MIVRPRPGLWEIAFALKGSILPRIWPSILASTAFAVAVVALSRVSPAPFARLSATPLALVGISLSIFMSFRNNACYDRWWEARRHWGQLIIDIRGLSRQWAGLADPQLPREWLVRTLIGYAHALAARLRGEDEHAAAEPWVAAGTIAAVGEPNPSNRLLAAIGIALAGRANAGAINEWRFQLMEERITSLSGVQAACERIKATPPPFAYSLLLHRTAWLFCLMLPFGLAGSIGWAAPVLTAILAYAFFGLDALGDELEDPFGHDDNDLPLDAMVRGVERELLAALGATELPPPATPIGYRLT